MSRQLANDSSKYALNGLWTRGVVLGMLAVNTALADEQFPLSKAIVLHLFTVKDFNHGNMVTALDTPEKVELRDIANPGFFLFSTCSRLV